jgi:hypothetical protein
MTPEGKVKEAVKKELRARGIWYYMPVQNGMGVVGIPDIVGCWNGWFVGIETKGPGKKGTVTANQKHQLALIQQHGGLALVIDDVQELRTILDDIERMKQELANDQQIEEPPGEA